ncbi:unnamed protein product [Paramecium octaurelia]|uniref:Uncharacterized protein n=1 Tax=Paramecium octaurelia TaxID=43137 RepID=A0A8S1XK65_PAROT|nr:unnamed protein product [Paramecium octaurelia]
MLRINSTSNNRSQRSMTDFEANLKFALMSSLKFQWNLKNQRRCRQKFTGVKNL